LGERREGEKKPPIGDQRISSVGEKKKILKERGLTNQKTANRRNGLRKRKILSSEKRTLNQRTEEAKSHSGRRENGPTAGGGLT